MASRHRFWETLPVDPQTDRICWPDDAESCEALAVDIVGATYVGALEHILSKALAALEGEAPEPGSADYARMRARAETLATLSAGQHEAVEDLVRELGYFAGYWPLAKLRNLPDAKLEWRLIPFGPDDEERPSVGLNQRLELHALYQQWVSAFAEELQRTTSLRSEVRPPASPPAPPLELGTWQDLTREQRRLWLDHACARALRSPPSSSAAGRTLQVDCSGIRDLEGLLCALGESANGPGGYLGRSIGGLEDCLFGGFGVSLPLTIELRASSALHGALGSAALAQWCREEIESRSLPWELAPERLWALLEEAHAGRATLLGDVLSMLRAHGVMVNER